MIRPPAELAAARALVNYRDIGIGPAGVRFARPGMGMTLNGIAQGYITDRVTEILSDAGMADVLVDVGELRAPGLGEAGQPWRVGLMHPAQPGGIIEIALARAAVATSAERGSPFTADARWHHILDPRTGTCPPADRAASVVAPTATVADALATSLTLLPATVAGQFLRRTGAGQAILSDPERAVQSLPPLRISA